MEEDVDVGGRPFSGSMRRSGFESGCNDDIIKRKIIHKEKRDDAKRQKDDYAAIATPFFWLITPSPMSQRKSWARYFWLTALLAQICGTVTFPCKKEYL